MNSHQRRKARRAAKRIGALHQTTVTPALCPPDAWHRDKGPGTPDPETYAEAKQRMAHALDKLEGGLYWDRPGMIRAALLAVAAETLRIKWAKVGARTQTEYDAILRGDKPPDWGVDPC